MPKSLFSYYQNAFGRDLIILTYSVEPQFRHVSYLVGMCRRFCVNCPMHHIIGTHLYTGCPSYKISKPHKLLQVWNSNLFFNVCGMPSAKNLWFLFHQSSAWHSAYISYTFSGLGFWTVFSRIMTLFLKMEAVIVLGKSILVGRSCRLDKIVLFDFFENQKIRCPLFWGEIW